MDEDLRALRRAATRDLESREAWLALGVALARAGIHDEAAAALYRARVLGAEESAARLRELGAPVSPWTHVAGDAAGSRCALVTGPRGGGVVVRSTGGVPRHIVIDEDGTVLGAVPSRLLRYDRRWLDEVGKWGFPDSAEVVTPVVAPGRLLALGGTRRDGILRTTSPDRRRFEASVGWIGEGQHIAADRSGAVACARGLIATFTPELEARTRFDATVWGGRLALHEGRIAAIVGARGGGLLAVFDLDGKELWSVVQESVASPPLFAADGSVVLVVSEGRPEAGGYSIRRYDAEGRPMSTTAPFGANLPAYTPFAALARDGAFYWLERGRLIRFEADGRVAWQNTENDVNEWGGLAVDRTGYVYAIGRHRGSAEGLVGIAPDGAAEFVVEDVTRVLALDGLGRVLALRNRELVAIG